MNTTILIAATGIAAIGLTVLGHSLFGTDIPTPTPPGPAAISATFSAGDVPPRDSIHLIDTPGRYGLGPELPGSYYAIVSDNLVRVDSSSFKILSVLRRQAEVLD